MNSIKSKYSFSKTERLKSKKVIDVLFAKGQSVFSYPYKFVFVNRDRKTQMPVQTVFSVPKRNFKLAVQRNRIKRIMREIYRHNKKPLYDALIEKDINIALVIIYLGKENDSEKTYRKGMVKGFNKLLDQL